MRQIGTISGENRAKRLADYLLTLGITTKLHPQGDDWAVWVHQEDQVAKAKSEFDAYLQDPDAAKYAGVAGTAQTLRKKAVKVQREHERQSLYLRDSWRYRSPSRIPVTLAMIAMSIATTLAIGLVPQVGRFLEDQLFITSVRSIKPEEWDPDRWEPTHWQDHLTYLDKVAHGEVWRLVTPIFMHSQSFFLHLVFNMFWLADFGGQIESTRGSWRFALLVLATAIVSNLAQYMVAGPWFHGMSGVVYGLLGFLWMRVRYEPNTHFQLRSNTVPLLLLWLLLCMTGYVGPVANTAHIAGLLAGMVIGVAPYLRDALELS